MGGGKYMACTSSPSILFLYDNSQIGTGFGDFGEDFIYSLPLDFVNFKRLKVFLDNYYEQAGKIDISDIRNV